MTGDALQARIQQLQAKYTALLTQAAQEGRTDDVQSLSAQMQQEIDALVSSVTQSTQSAAASPASEDEVQEDQAWDEEVEEGDDESDDEEEDDEEEDDEEEDEDD